MTSLQRIEDDEENRIPTQHLGFWIEDSAKGTSGVRSSVNRNIWRLFSEHGISIPFPQREVRVVGLPDGFAAAGVAAGHDSAAANGALDGRAPAA